MKKIILILFFMNAFIINVYPTFLGNIETVHSEGAVNSLKNPAIIPWQKASSSFGAYLVYEPLIYYKSIGDVDFPSLIDGKIDSKVEDKMSGTVILTYSARFGDYGFAIGLSSLNAGLVSYSKNQSILYDDPSGFKNESEGKELSINPVLNISFGKKIKSDSSFGIKLLAGYSYKKIERYEIQNLPFHEKTSTETSHGLLTELQLGYFYKTGNSEAGLVLKSGRFNLKKSKVDYDDTTKIPQQGSNDFSFYYFRSGGPGFSVGGSYQATPSVKIILEGEYSFAEYFRSRSISNETWEVETTWATLDSIFSIRYGIDFLIIPDLKLSLGGRFFSAKIMYGDELKSLSLEFIGVTTGFIFDYSLSKFTQLVFGFNLIYFYFNQDMEMTSSDSISAKSHEFFTSFILGVTNNF